MSIFDDPVTDLRIERCERVKRALYARYGPAHYKWPDKAHRSWSRAIVRSIEADERWMENVGQHITITFAPRNDGPSHDA